MFKHDGKYCTLDMYATPSSQLCDYVGFPSSGIYSANRFECYADGDQISTTDDQTLDSNGETYSYTSTFTFTPSIKENGLVLFCSVGGPAVLLTNQAELTTIITINVISKKFQCINR